MNNEDQYQYHMNAFKRKILGLETEIKSAAQKYYNDGSSPISDEEFDAKVDALRSLSPESCIVNSVGWGYEINSDTTPGEKFKHLYGVAGSLSKCRTWDELKDYRDRWIDASLKLDGISIVMYYKNGVRYAAVTRGDGVTGINVSDKVNCIISENLLNNSTFCGAIRGEIVMNYSKFEDYKRIHPEAKNPRNTVAGLIGAKECSDDLKFLNILPYNVVGMDASCNDLLVKDDNISIFANNEFLAKNFEYCAPRSLVKLTEDTYFDTLSTKKAAWDTFNYPSDGIVLSRTYLSYNPDTGYISPKAIAFKFQAEQAETSVIDVEWNLTKTKYLMPRLIVNTVSISGTNVSAATGYNAEYIRDNRIGPGAEIIISKHGEIIPNVDKVIRGVDYTLPTHCPCCNHELIWDGVHLKCANPECADSKTQNLLIWIHNLAPVDGLGDELIIKYLLTYRDNLSIDDLMRLDYKSLSDYFYSESGHKKLIYDMIKKLFTGRFEISSALKALNIPRLGDKTAEKLSKYPQLILDCLDSFDRSNAGNDIGEYANLIDIVGNATAATIYANIDKFKQLNLIRDRIVWDSAPNTEAGPKGSVAITGKLSVPRNQFIQELRSNGWEVKDISKSTSYLITDDPESNSSKNKKANEWDIQKITEAEFRKIM